MLRTQTIFEIGNLVRIKNQNTIFIVEKFVNATTIRHGQSCYQIQIRNPVTNEVLTKNPNNLCQVHSSY